jgi:predicted TIM-barrel fold metal-dependent hydrolase
MQVDIIDAHAHLAPHQDEGDNAPADDLISQMEMTSVDIAVVLAAAPEKGNLAATEQHNEFIADVTAQFHDQLIGMGSVHPGDGKKAMQELDRFSDLKLQGVNLHPVVQHFHCDSSDMYALAETCSNLDMPVVIHSYFPGDVLESERLYKLVIDNKDTTFVLAHMGGHAFLDCYRYVQAHTQNVYFDVSTIAIMFRRSPYTEHLRWLIQQIGVDRVMFGSDYPTYSLVDALAAVDDLGLSYEESEHILGKTAAALLNL